MKTKEFSEKADGHSLRAIAFFSKLEEPVNVKGTLIDPEIVKEYDIEDVSSINQFKKDHKDIRQQAKAPSFALQYGGTYKTLNKNIGLPLNVAKAIEKGYHELYSGLAEFSQKNIDFAVQNGYMECAFGLRLRTPILGMFKETPNSLPYEALAEGRSASNATTQSWGTLINRATNALEDTLAKSPMRYKIFAMNTIHDAAYYLVKAEPEVVKWLNDELIKEMSWNQHSLIYSEEVPLEAELDIGPSWDKQLTIPNGLSVEEIKQFMLDKKLI